MRLIRSLYYFYGQVGFKTPKQSFQTAVSKPQDYCICKKRLPHHVGAYRSVPHCAGLPIALPVDLLRMSLQVAVSTWKSGCTTCWGNRQWRWHPSAAS